MFLKIFKKTFLLILLTLISIPINVLAYSDYIIAGGQNIGIEIKSKGVLVVGTYKVNNQNLAYESGIRTGDVIVSIDDQKVLNIEDMVSKINQTIDGNIKIGYIRNDLTKYTNLKMYKEDNNYKTGIYVKDSITGIGTLTFIDPNTKFFGALGHEIIEKSTGQILDTETGTIFDSEVVSINPSTNGIAGEKTAKYYIDRVKGNIFENTTQGVFGKYNSIIDKNKLYKVADFNEIKKGEAKILTVLNGTEVKEYSIDIIKTSNNQKIKNISFNITDDQLLQKTGGIVQGMSGSPIIQGDKIIGAVTHVVLEEPTKGYGIFIKYMLEEAEN